MSFADSGSCSIRTSRELYGVTTKPLNRRFAAIADRFPEDFAYQLTQQEFTALISQIAISKPGRGGHRKLPWVFTEHGVAMLSSVLRSPTAVRVNIEIMRAFVRLRRLMATPGELVEQLTRLAQTVQMHDEQIQSIIQALECDAGAAGRAAPPHRISRSE